ncbi:MAG TPA: prepilin-type N-terminal cleavage/methylation domain-containing protein [Longimicrobium sp.]|nr:prepilin-type N-terminal cleavage/methylation domain-containing protein [Longimicrobium sp.]
MKRHGFTLIELMIVVVIIGILAAIAIPKFQVASFRAKEKEADLVLKSVYQAQVTYKAQHGAFTTNLADLQTVGYEAPTHLDNYTIPGASGYGIPLCLASTGTWSDRSIDADGTIDDC